MLTRYDHLRAATARLSSQAEEQEFYLRKLLLPIAVDGDSPSYGCDELGLQFEDYFVSAKMMLEAGELSRLQFDALNSLNTVLDTWSGEQNADFWRRDALRDDPRWAEVRLLAQRAIDLLPIRVGGGDS
jgi:hypothetical protein